MREGLQVIGTWDIAISLIRHVTLEKMNDKDMQHCHFLKSRCYIGGPP